MVRVRQKKKLGFDKFDKDKKPIKLKKAAR